MRNTIFYSWQSDTAQSDNRYLIRGALEEALQKLNVGLVLDEATRGVSGTPVIADTILQKIDAAVILVVDLTLVGRYSETKWTPNPNVLVEYGYALKVLGGAQIIPVMNTHYGEPDKLPFDLGHRRVSAQYILEPNSPSDKKKERI